MDVGLDDALGGDAVGLLLGGGEAYGEAKDKEEDLLGPATLAKMQSGELSFEDEAAAANAAGAAGTDGAAPAEAEGAGKE